MENDHPGNEKSPPGKTDELVNIVNVNSQAYNLTYLSRLAGWSWHLSALSLLVFKGMKRGGCQGFKGPLPSAFLDKYFKELAYPQAGRRKDRMYSAR